MSNIESMMLDFVASEQQELRAPQHREGGTWVVDMVRFHTGEYIRTVVIMQADINERLGRTES